MTRNKFGRHGRETILNTAAIAAPCLTMAAQVELPFEPLFSAGAINAQAGALSNLIPANATSPQDYEGSMTRNSSNQEVQVDAMNLAFPGKSLAASSYSVPPRVPVTAMGSRLADTSAINGGGVLVEHSKP